MVERPFVAYRGDDPYVFVSYAHADSRMVYPELIRLNEQGFRIWYDEGISPGSVWREELANAIENCTAFLLFVSAGTNTSDHCMKELNFALDGDRAVLAVHLDESELSAGLRMSLSDRQAIVKHEHNESAYQQILDEALRGYVATTAGPAAVAIPGRNGRKLGRRLGAVAASLFLIVMVAWVVQREDPSPAESASEGLPFSGRPAIAVLPLRNLSGKSDDDYFVDGLTDDLIDRLASWRQFPVIGRFSSFGYRDASKEPQIVARELGARYLIQGSVRRSQNTLRVNVRLFDADSGEQIWSEGYDRPAGDVLEVQDAISSAVVGQMYPYLDEFDQRRALRRSPADMTAWDLTQKGNYYRMRGGRDDNRQAQASYQQAIERDPEYAFATAGLALSHYQSVSFGYSEAPERSIELLIETAERSVALDSMNALSHHALGHAYALNGNRDGMIRAYNTSLELNPSSALVAICAGEGFAMAGESKAAIAALETAMRLSPDDPLVFWTYHAFAMAYFGEGKDDLAVTWAQRALSHNPEFVFGYRTLASSLAHAGRLEEAREALKRANELQPSFTYATGRRVLVTGSPEFAERYMGGLRIAGLQ